MDSRQLTPDQAGKLYEALFPHLNYLLRLKKRLEAKGFPVDDPLMVAAADAYQATWRLRQQAHGLSVRMGSGERKPG
jgi:hypothetical protein